MFLKFTALKIKTCLLGSALLMMSSCQTFQKKTPPSSLVPIGVLDLSLTRQTLKEQELIFPGDPYVAPVLHENKIITELNTEWITCSEISEKISSPKNVWAMPNQKGGLSVSPYVINSNVILAFKSGLIMNVDLRNGRRIWSTQIIGSLVERPIVSRNSHVFFATSNQTLYSLKLKDGTIRWAYQFGENKEAKVRTLNKPLFHRNEIYIGNNDGELKSLNLDTGALNWNYKPEVASKATFKDYMGDLFITGQILYASRYDGHVFAIDLSNPKERKLKWHFETKENITASSYDSGLYYVGTNKGSVHALDVKTGKDTWHKKPSFGDAAISTISSGEKNTYITGTRGGIFLLKGHTGELQWDGNLNTPIFTPPLYFKGMLLFPAKEKSKFYVYLSA